MAFLDEGTFLQKVFFPQPPSSQHSPCFAFLLAWGEQESEVQAPSGMALGF